MLLDERINPLVSIIVPVYNVEDYLEECINSILDQTYRNLEIILIDDGSTDNSAIMCDSFSRINDRIIVIHKENGGLSSARNVGLEMAKGSYIMFVDSDDYISETMVRDMLSAAQNDNYKMVVSPITPRIEDLYKGGRINNIEKNPEEILQSFFTDNIITTSASGKLYDSSIWQGIKFPEGLIFEDFATIYKVVIRCSRICELDSAFYYYRQNPTSITGASFSEKKMDYYSVAHSVSNDLIELGYRDLLPTLTNRTTRYSISFFRDISRSNYSNSIVVDYIIKQIRKNIIAYLFSGYKASSKIYGLLIVIAPCIALQCFRLGKSIDHGYN